MVRPHRVEFIQENVCGHIVNSIEDFTFTTKEANSKMQVYQAVAIKTNEDGERTEILEHELFLAESEQKARDKFVRGLSEEYDAGSDDVELTTFL